MEFQIQGFCRYQTSTQKPCDATGMDYLIEHDALPSSRSVLLGREEHKVAVYVIGRLRRHGDVLSA